MSPASGGQAESHDPPAARPPKCLWVVCPASLAGLRRNQGLPSFGCSHSSCELEPALPSKAPSLDSRGSNMARVCTLTWSFQMSKLSNSSQAKHLTTSAERKGNSCHDFDKSEAQKDDSVIFQDLHLLGLILKNFDGYGLRACL